MAFETNPFTVLSLIAAPAVLTNASSVLALGTSNRFARAVDRARVLSAELEGTALPSELVATRLGQLDRVERRSLLLVRAMAAFYTAVGCFGAASLISLIGSGIASEGARIASRIALVLGLLVGMGGVSSISYGCLLLVRETRLAVKNLVEEAEFTRARRALRSNGDDTHAAA